MLAKEIRKARIAAGLTQEALAGAAGLSREFVNYVERGKREPTVKVFVRLSQAMGIHPADLLERIIPRGAVAGSRRSIRPRD